MEVPRAADHRAIGRVRLLARGHIPVGADNLVGEVRPAGVVLLVGAAGPIGTAAPGCDAPYYGTIFAGVALGTLITVAAVGYVPPRPHPDLCWYWADPYGQTGYWDYC